MNFKGFTLDNFQVDSINAIERNESVVVSAPTGSGKTLIADYIIDKYLKTDKRIIYTAPIKALSNQKYKDFCRDYGEDKVGIMTGDIVINPQAQVVIMTTEIYRNMVMTGDVSIENISYVIFDEIHFINDIERGVIWEESIIFSLLSVRFLCLSATIPNAEEFSQWIRKIKKHDVSTITHDIRNVPLHKYFFDTDLGITSLSEINDILDVPDYTSMMRRRRSVHRRARVKPPFHVDLIRDITDKTPILFFCFSRANCEKNALDISQKNLFKGKLEIIQILQKHLRKAPPDISKLHSTQLLRTVLPKGIGFHHAGLLPVMKEMVEELFSKGLLSVLYTTETFAVGINMPAKTVCFESLRKFDGIGFRLLHSKEFFQIAGRAGRRGIDKEGYVYVMLNRNMLDCQKVSRLTSKDVEPIRSQFRLTVNAVLNLIKLHTSEEINVILSQSFFEFQKQHLKISIRKRYENLVRKLQKLGFVTKENELTEKGDFASKIFCDELLFSEIFATNFWKDLNEYQILLIIACLAYEDKDRVQFYNKERNENSKSLSRKIRDHAKLSRDERLNMVNVMTSVIHPMFEQKDFFVIYKNTSMQEGDLIRYISQILDRIGQLLKATTEAELTQKLVNCKHMVKNSLEDISLL